MNKSSVYISEKVKNANNETINPATEEKQDKIIDSINKWITETPIVQWTDWEILTRDVWIDKLFGSNPIVKNGNVKTSVINDSNVVNVRLAWLWMERKVSILDYSTCAIQLSWVWAGTIVFEVTSNGWDFWWLLWVNVTTNSAVNSATTNGIFKFNVSGLNQIRVRCSAYTSWTVLVNFTMSSWEQQQPLSQRATTFELNTFDTNLQTAIGTTQMYQTGFELESVRQFAPTIAPTQPTTYVENKFAKVPQQFRRLRVETGGSERLPFAQEPYTNKQIVTDPDNRRILESILVELKNIRSVLLNDGSPIVE